MSKRISGYRKGSTIKINGKDFKVSYEDGYDGSTMFLTNPDIVIRDDCDTQNLYQQGMGPMGSGGRQENFYSVFYSKNGSDFQEYGKVSYLPTVLGNIVN